MNQAISDELAQSAESYVQTNIIEFEKPQRSSGKPSNFKHIVVFAVNEAEKIVGFRYFFFMPVSTFCQLFATFVDSNYRRQGIATRLIMESFDIAMSYGCSEFGILLTQPSAEKDALFNLYRRFAKASNGKYKFTIKYWDIVENYGDGGVVTAV